MLYVYTVAVSENAANCSQKSTEKPTMQMISALEFTLPSF